MRTDLSGVGRYGVEISRLDPHAHKSKVTRCGQNIYTLFCQDDPKIKIMSIFQIFQGILMNTIQLLLANGY